MSEVIEAENLNEEAAENSRQIVINITDSNIRYDTDMSAPEVVFWLKIVEEMVVQKVMSGEDINE